MIDTIHVVCYGEVLWDNMPDMRRVGGAPLNVCYHLNKNGVRSLIASQVGNDADGRELLEAIAALDVDTAFIRADDRRATSTVEVNILEDGSPAYEIVEDVAWDHMAYDPAVAAQIRSAHALVFGSLVARSERSRETLYAYLEEAKLAVYDVNLRPPFYDRDMVLGLIARCHLLKVNHEELDLIAQWIGADKQSEDGKLARVLESFPGITEMLLTKGAQGARYYSREENISVPAPLIKPVDTVGSGDSFLAAYLSQKIIGKSTREAMEYAVWLSAFVATQHGACPPYTEERLQAFQQSVSTG